MLGPPPSPTSSASPVRPDGPVPLRRGRLVYLSTPHRAPSAAARVLCCVVLCACMLAVCAPCVSVSLALFPHSVTLSHCLLTTHVSFFLTCACLCLGVVCARVFPRAYVRVYVRLCVRVRARDTVCVIICMNSLLYYNYNIFIIFYNY